MIPPPRPGKTPDPKLRPASMPSTWQVRPDTFDIDIWNAIVVENEYDVQETFSHNDVIMDIGCHIGIFSYFAWTKGCRHIFAYEMDEENYKLAIQNLGTTASVRHCAVVGSDEFIGKVAYKENKDQPEYEKNLKNTGGYFLSHDGTNFVDSMPFDCLVDEILCHSANGKIKMLKIDCEGAEWPILLTSKKLTSFESIIGEYHLWGYGEERGIRELRELFYDNGFIVQIVPHAVVPYKQGNFWAYKKPLMSEYATNVVSLDGSHHFFWRNHSHALGNNLLATKDG
jgi:FkbM family methyltransferase